ncbi:HAMP domain-containing histidine kinase, partial [Nostocales cyanobacterium LEGE 12452]|nr:HAMP domain-containing histidine kinase [Nostocales cyanobacterium LEGE 12452]
SGDWGVGNQSSTAYSLKPTPQIRIHTEVTDLNLVRITIADNGLGIEESLRSRLFDPFFTTKPVGKGSGLGLSISYQIIVQKHRGNISCKSSVGKGAEFAIEIPIEQQPHISSQFLKS